jgi:hypothetical protein
MVEKSNSKFGGDESVNVAMSGISLMANVLLVLLCGFGLFIAVDGAIHSEYARYQQNRFAELLIYMTPISLSLLLYSLYSVLIISGRAIQFNDSEIVFNQFPLFKRVEYSSISKMRCVDGQLVIEWMKDGASRSATLSLFKYSKNLPGVIDRFKKSKKRRRNK